MSGFDCLADNDGEHVSLDAVLKGLMSAYDINYGQAAITLYRAIKGSRMSPRVYSWDKVRGWELEDDELPTMLRLIDLAGRYGEPGAGGDLFDDDDIPF